ncbi:hypothetical protein Tco_0897484 [Tanacetum coccineum]
MGHVKVRMMGQQELAPNNWKENDEMVDIIREDLWQKAYNEMEVAKEVIVISSRDEDLLADEANCVCLFCRK